MELNKEILKGHIDTMILAILEKNDSYGFEIAKNVLEQTTFELKDGTLYISLKRLESKGLLNLTGKVVKVQGIDVSTTK